MAQGELLEMRLHRFTFYSLLIAPDLEKIFAWQDYWFFDSAIVICKTPCHVKTVILVSQSKNAILAANVEA